MTIRRTMVAALVGLTAVLGLSAPAFGAGDATITATITNSIGEPQSGTVNLWQVNGGGTNFTGGSYSRSGIEPGDYQIEVRASSMDGSSRWYSATDSTGVAAKADATTVTLVADGTLHFDMVMPAIAKVSGRVVNTSGDPISGVPVTRVNTLGGSGPNATTATDGSFTFGYVRAGTWNLSVPARGEYSGANAQVVVGSSGTVTTPDMVVQLLSSIHGTITDDGTRHVDGIPRPIPLAYVEVYTAGTHQYQGSDYTDLDGSYTVGGLGGQDLIARYSDPYKGYQRQLYEAGDPVTWAGEDPFTLSPGENRQVDAALAPIDPPVPSTYTLTGVVLDALGDPVPGIDVYDGQTLGTTTDRTGHWYLDAPAGSYDLTFGPVQLWADHVFGDQPGWYPARRSVEVVDGIQHDDVDVTIDSWRLHQWHGARRHRAVDQPANHVAGL